ncbi:hypothetical protein HY640_04740 [Candidatus Woesearchaeota archaeon]|nr:hypothetical protein [Candidatus Woesearchaeota archaeon]
MLSAGTASATLSVNTDEAATCRYSSVSGTAYSSMSNTFSTTGSTSHSTTVSGLSNGNSYSYYVRCRDASGNANANGYAVSFSVSSVPSDTAPPVLSGGSPSGALAAGTTSASLLATTDEATMCRYSVTSGTAYSSMSNTFSSTGGTSHSSSVSGLANGNSYNYYVRCQDSAGNANANDYVISFSVSVAPSQVQAINVPVLVIKYFPVDPSGQKLDIAVAGTDADLAGVRSFVDSITNQGIQKLTEGTKYHGYKDGSATPTLNYYVTDTKEFLSPLPVSSFEVPWNQGKGIYRPDYRKILSDINVCDYVENRGVRQVWLWGYHYGSIEPVESDMSMGTNSRQYWNFPGYGDVSNSERTDDLPVCKNTYVLYNYNFERGLGELLEDHGHQIESLYGFIDPVLWQTFKSPFGQQSPTVNRCGWTHSPPNTVADYDWANEADVLSDCEDWKPEGTGQAKVVDCHTWYGQSCLNDGGAGFKVWWMQNIPGMNNGLVYNGKSVKNWWIYYGDIDAALAAGKGLT